MAETKKKRKKKKENRFYFKETYLKVFETQSYYPQSVPKSNRDQQKKNPQKELFPPSSLFLLQKTEETHACISQGGGGLGETPCRGAEVVADEEGGGGLWQWTTSFWR
jgi:hypothetical protein